MLVEGPPWARTETEVVDLREVRWIGWDIEVFDPTGTMWLRFYDQDPDLELTFLGFMTRNSAARRLGQVPIDDLAKSEVARQHLVDFAQSHGIDSTVDLDTLEPLPERRPPLAERTTYDGAALVLWPEEPKGRDSGANTVPR